MDTGRSSRRRARTVRAVTIGAVLMLCALVAVVVAIWRGTTPFV